MPFSNFEGLPLTVLESICDSLASCDTGRRSLFAFSLASRRCCDAAARQRFERIDVAPKDRHQLDHILSRSKAILQADGRCKCVRRVRISGQATFEAEDVDQYFWEQQSRAWTDPDAEACVEDDTFSKRTSLQYFAGSVPACTPENKSRAHDGWKPLAEFLGCCTGLNDLYWASTDQVPRCILTVLHHKLPRCRLHVHTFSLRSLYQDRDQLHDVDVDEYALATSPSLYSICVKAMHVDGDGRLDYNEEAALQMAAGAASNLTSVHVDQGVAADSIEYRAAVRSPRPPWQGFFASDAASVSSLRGRLRYLSFGRGGSVFDQKLQNWTSHTDFSELRSLDMGVPVNRPAFQSLIHIAERGAFQRLQSFSFHGIKDAEDDDVDTLFTNLLTVLTPLQSLTDTSSPGDDLSQTAGTTPSFTPTTQRHGPSLRILKLQNLLSLADVQTLRTHSPNLRVLHARLPPTNYDVSNKIYHLLGSFPHIDTLNITLYNPYPSPDDGTTTILRHALASALATRALDKPRATSIFAALLAANRAARPGVVPSLRCLHVYSVGDGQPWNDAERLLDWVGRSWVVERRFADVGSGDVVVGEIGAGERLGMEGDIQDVHGGDRDAWDEAWPEGKGRRDWMEVWRGLL